MLLRLDVLPRYRCRVEEGNDVSCKLQVTGNRTQEFRSNEYGRSTMRMRAQEAKYSKIAVQISITIVLATFLNHKVDMVQHITLINTSPTNNIPVSSI